MGDLGAIGCIGKGTFQPIIESHWGVALQMSLQWWEFHTKGDTWWGGIFPPVWGGGECVSFLWLTMRLIIQSRPTVHKLYAVANPG